MKSDRKTLYTLISIGFVLTILIAVFALLFHAHNIATDSEHNQANIKITDFSINKHWEYVGGLLFDCSFNLTIANKGEDNVTGLELKVKLFHNNSEVQVGNYFFGTYENGTIIEPLGIGEVREFKGTIMSVVGQDAYQLNFASNETSIVAIAILNGVVLDQRRSE